MHNPKEVAAFSRWSRDVLNFGGEVINLNHALARNAIWLSERIVKTIKPRKPPKSEAKKPAAKKKTDPLRKKAEALVDKRLSKIERGAVTVIEARRLIHELKTHQIELEIQSEKLRNSQLALEKARKRYSDLFEFAPVGYFTFDKSGLILEVNLTGVALLGVERSPLMNMPFVTFVKKGFSNIFFEHIKKVLETDKRQTCELEITREDSTKFFAYLDSGRSDEGTVRTAITDITKRKHAEEALQKERDRLQAVMDGAKDPHLVYLDREFNFVLVNEAYARTCGYRPEEMIGKNHFTLYPHAENEAIFARVRDTGQPFDVRDKPFEFPDQPERGVTYWDWTLTPVKDAVGRVEGLIFVLHETTERKRAEEALRESESRQQAILDNAPVAIFVKDLQGRYVFLNRSSKAWMKEMGIDEDKAIGGTDREILPPAIADMFSLSDRQALDTTAPLHEDERILQPDGVHSYIEKKFPLRDSSGNIYAIAGIATDITERKKAEEMILQLNSDLAVRNRELEELNEELEVFNYSISHDLRAPLRSMSGFAKILEEEYAGKLDDTGRDYLTRISKGAFKMAQLIQGLLNLSKISRQKASRTDVDMSALAASVVSALRKEEPGRCVEVSIQERLSASADPALMELVLTNLIGNAWKFTSETAKAKIEFGALQEDGQTVFFVRDNGPGFDPSLKTKLFMPFQRLHSEKEFEGTGIGLAVVERIIKAHGGRVWGQGAIRKGVVIYFTVD